MKTTKRKIRKLDYMPDPSDMNLIYHPYPDKMSEAGKMIIRHICKEKPWEKYPDEKYFSLVFDTKEIDVNDGDFDCLFAITYSKREMIGAHEVFDGSEKPVCALEKRGDKYILSFVSDTCKQIFTENLPEYLDLWRAWDEICRRPTFDD